MRSLFLLLIATLAATASVHAAFPAMRERTNLRDVRYGEILVITGGPFSFLGHVYNTLGLNDCPETEWKALDPAKLKKEFKARAVILNGPRYFLMDANALANPGGVATFGALQARHLANVEIPLTTLLRGHSKPYTENTVKRTSKYVFRKGLPIYELISPDGKTYVMQSYSRIIDPRLSMSDLPGLGKRLKLPPGWQYRERIPADDLVLRASGIAKVLQDELENSYQLVTPLPEK